MPVKRSQVYALRGAIHAAEQGRPDRERDLAANACCLLWESDWPRLLRALRRLNDAYTERWGSVYLQGILILRPVDFFDAREVENNERQAA